MTDALDSKSRRYFLHVLLTLVGVAVCICLFVWVYKVDMDKQYRSQALSQLKDTCQIQSNNIAVTLDRNFYVLEGASEFISLDTGRDWSILKDLLHSVAKSANFNLVGAAGPDGLAYTSADRTVDISDRQYFTGAMEGRRTVERVDVGKLVGEPRIILAVPIWKEDRAVGMVYGSYETARIDAMLSSDALDGALSSYIVDADSGQAISSGTNALPWRGGWTDGQGNTASSAVSRGGSGSMSFRENGEEYYLYYTPMAQKDWVMVTAAARKVFDGQYAFINTNVRNLFLAFAGVLIAAAVYLVLLSIRARQSISNAYEQLAFFNDNLPGCVFKGELNGVLRMRYASDGLFELTGYTPRELQQELGGEYLRLLEPEDVPMVLSNVLTVLREKGNIREQYRIRRRDGQMRWVLSRYRLASENGESCAYGVITDITDSVLREQEMELLRQKYQIALEHTAYVFAEYDPAEGILWCHGDKARALGLEEKTRNVPESLIASGWIQPGSVEDCRKLYQRIRSGEPYASAELEVAKDGEQTLWLRIDMTNLFDTSGKLLRAVSIMQNVTKAKQAEYDPLTGLLNRASFETRVSAVLKDIVPEQTYAFALLDVDSFKGVNDSMGHFFGDQVLRGIADVLRASFRASDLICRLGGDEFAVMLCGLTGEPAANAKIRGLVEAVTALTVEDASCCVSISCGVAYAPQHGESFQALYTHADEALYRAKAAGRSRFIVYGEDG